MSVRTLVVSETRFVREALAQAIVARHPLEVVATLPPALVPAAVEELQPDIALLHLGIPVGPDLARTISLVAPGCAVVALGVKEDEASVLPWAEAGVAGYVPPQMSLDQLGDCVRMVAQGGAACTPATAAILLRRVARGAAVGTELRNLTTREGEIAELVAAGLSNKEIARNLSISLPTVKNHVHHILNKLEVSRRYLVARELRQFPRQRSVGSAPDADAAPRAED